MNAAAGDAGTTRDDQTTEAGVVATEQRRLRGSVADSIWAFKGIPYAAPPFGAHRFAAPAPPQPWHGIRDATAFGATAPKPPYRSPFDMLLPEPVIEGKDCLNLNVWTPDPAAPGLPVMVWIHGGSFVNGTGAIGTYDGSAFARDGVVCVTINYRLGFEGFGLVEAMPANRGLLDQLAALRWVQDNIAAFGGNPARVTIAGESAGAMSVTTLLALPESRGLFTQAIAQSGAGHHVLTADTAARVTAAVAERLGVPATAAGLDSVAVDRLVAEQAALSLDISLNPAHWPEIAANGMVFEPVVDGTLLRERPVDAIAEGAGRDARLMAGTNSDEHSLFLVPTGLADQISEEQLRQTLSLLLTVDAAAALTTYRQQDPGATPGELFIAVLTDWFFRIPAVRLAQVRSRLDADTYMYEFAWRTPVLDGRLGSCHALEVGFVFDNLADPETTALAGGDPPQALADEMHRAWLAFVRDGDPGWEPYGEARAVRCFADTSTTVHDPRPESRRLWDGVR